MFIIITAPKAAGKSTVLTKVAGHIINNGKSVGGIISPRIWKDGVRQGYNVITYPGREKYLLASEFGEVKDVALSHCSFTFSGSAIDAGNRAIINGMEADLLIVDEIGKLELGGGGWGRSMADVARRRLPTILSVREDVVDSVESAWGIHSSAILRVNPEDHDGASRSIIKHVGG